MSLTAQTTSTHKDSLFGMVNIASVSLLLSLVSRQNSRTHTQGEEILGV
jgi:hypothetical protein